MAILDISCDEAGHTGPDLLHADQRYFGFGSVSIQDDEAYALISAATEAHPVQMPELKAARLMKSAGGRALISRLIDEAGNRFAVNLYDKLLALCGWVFEYIYEPVYQKSPWLLYEKNLHRFVAMFTWLWFRQAGGESEEAIRQFQRYMRSRDENEAPLLFERIQGPLGQSGNEDPFDLILRFARGYRDIIISDNASLSTALPDGGRWTLDLSASALWSHLNYWGRTGRPLRVRCDASKPLEAIAEQMTGDDNDPGIQRARDKLHSGPLGWELAEPISFVDSRDHPGVQLADIVAGAAVNVAMRGLPSDFEVSAKRIEENILPDTILPDMSVIDLSQRAPAVNYLILYDLAKRAERGADPIIDLAEMYSNAEVSWSRGGINFHT